MASRRGSRYALISCDAHAGADLLDYKPYLEREFHDDFEAWAASYQEGAWEQLDAEMVSADDPNVRMGVSSFGSPYNWDSAKRLEHMDGDGIAAEVIFPNTVPPFYPRAVFSAPGPVTAEEYRLRSAGIKAHNRWLVDFCSLAPGRRAGLVQLFLDDVDDAIAEVRWAREAGLMGVLLPGDHTLKLVNLYERRLDPFWATCCDLGLAVTRHTSHVGPPETPESGPATEAVGIWESRTLFQRGLGHLVIGGVFERFPDLKFVMTEIPSTWVPGELEKMDFVCRWGTTEGSVIYPRMHRGIESLSKTPTEYFRRNVWLGVSLMQRWDVQIRHQIGIDRMVWGSDYPHYEGSWPLTRLALRWNFWDVPEDEIRTMTSENAANLYGFDLDFVQEIADKIGPTPQEVATPVSAEELPGFCMNQTISDAILALRPRADQGSR